MDISMKMKWLIKMKMGDWKNKLMNEWIIQWTTINIKMKMKD